ncbi:MAG: hypothetical protein FJ086_13150, partial [Deltaproteobacteria bacterium]|nr:hypothetical protein [Deltaproteobacteria bacterium]
AEPLVRALRDGAALKARLDALCPLPGATDFIVPGRDWLGERLAGLTLEGESCLGALGLARLAATRGLPPARAVVSASLAEGPDAQPVLHPVSGGEGKLRAAAAERPGLPVYLCADGDPAPPPGQPLHLLLPGMPLSLLADRLLPPAPAPVAQVLSRLRAADGLFALQRYDECRPLYREVLHLLKGLPRAGRPPQAEAWRTQARLRLAAVELHAGRTAAARRLFRGEATRAPGVSPFLRVEALTHQAGVWVDSFAPAEALRLVGPVARAWERRLAGARAHASDEQRFALLQLLGVLRRAHLLNGDPRRALAVQDRLLAWSPRAQWARSRCDRADLLRRLERPADALRELARARDALPWVFDLERAQVEGFMVYTEGLIRLERPRPGLFAAGVEARAAALPEALAARWRLEQLGLLLRLGAGDATAVAGLVEGCRRERSPLRQWLRGLGLLRACRLHPAPAEAPWDEAAATFERGLDGVRTHPVLHRAARGFIRSVRQGRPSLPDVAALLRYTAY